MSRIVDVAVPVRVPRSFHYLVSEESAEQLALGSLVQVPFRNRLTHGFVLGFPGESDIDPSKLKTVESILLSEPLFDEAMLKFLKWVADYYCYPIGEVIASAIPRQYWKALASKRKRKTKETPSPSLGLPSSGEKPTLTDEQSFAVARILDPEDKKPVLLHGVTGSGKTEVYMTVLEHILGQGMGGIVLVPEIALTPQLLGRFSARFPNKVAVLHSELTPREKFLQYEQLRTGTAKVVVGARSAIFAPVKNLGLVIVDEEHEPSYKQEDSLRYHARDVAIVRANLVGAKVILGSATPSLESYANMQSGRYTYVTLLHRVNQRPLPKTTFVDLRDKSQAFSPTSPWLSRVLVQRLDKMLKENRQSMLFLNRLGFAHFLFCDDCGHTWRCKNCDVALTYYQSPPTLKCHYCGVINSVPGSCEECQGIALRTMGVGTEQVEKELKVIFPNARTTRLDRSLVKTRQDLEATLNSIARGDVDIVVGTQMMAKGHDFPGIGLVGILVADASLNVPDFRANERTFQIITQVAGRAGRAETPGEVIIQTINPDHPVLLAAAEHRVADFYRLELYSRKEFGFPPFQRMAMLRFQHANVKTVEAFANEVVKTVRHHIKTHDLNCVVLGPAEAPLSKLKNFYRWQCMLRSDSVKTLQGILKSLSQSERFKKTSVRMDIDVDPVSSL